MKSKKKPSNKRANKLAPSRKYVNKIVDWCVKTYGKSRYNRDFPEIHYRKKYYVYDDTNTIAFYDDHDGIIYINKDENKNLRALANSIIHEYTHYKQNMRHYDVLSMYLPYKSNPLEIEANQIAKRDTKKCLKDILAE